MTVTVKHAKTNAISDWTQAQLDEQISLGNFAPGTTLANIVLPSDWNNDHTLTGIGTMAEQNANNVAITGGTINNASIGATTPSTGAFTTVTATTSGTFGTSTSVVTPLTVTSSGGANNTRGIAFNISTSAATFPYARILVPSGSGGALSFFTGDSSYDANEQMRIGRSVSAVNYVQVTGGATNNSVKISGQGSDATVNMQFDSKGSGSIFFTTNNSGSKSLEILPSNSPANFLQFRAANTTLTPTITSTGTDTNVAFGLITKGTGAIDLAAGSSGVNISNGGTVTAITRTNAGSSYTSKPSVAITAPTTAGGVTALASVNQMYVSGVTIANGGTGYTVNDVLTVVGGTQTGVATLTVSTVSAGVITAVTISSAGAYSVLPTSPVSVTGGTGTGATFNLTWSIISFNIDNAGSGYIEQPTVSFSGGGGSGASAYASVGSGTTLKTIGNTLSFTTPAGEAVRVIDNGATTVNYWQMQGRQTGGGVLFSAQGTDSNIASFVSSKGSGNVTLATNNFAQIQFNVSHTASAVNYVQVTGGATTTPVAISAQGSDTNIRMNLFSKGTESVDILTNGGAVRQARFANTASSANWVEMTGAIAGSAPAYKVAGSDTNIDLSLVSKGTGAVKFQTAGGLQAQVANLASANMYWQLQGGLIGSTRPSFGINNTSAGGAGLNIYNASGSPIRFQTNGNGTDEQFVINHTASAVNYVQVTGSATTAAPVISSQGSDANVELQIRAKGTGNLTLQDGNGFTGVQILGRAASGDSFLTVQRDVSKVNLAIGGAATNADISLTPKGTGLVRFGTYTAGALTATGYINIKAADGTTYKVLVST